jgi:hypothetical protein
MAVTYIHVNKGLTSKEVRTIDVDDVLKAVSIPVAQPARRSPI